MAKCTRWFGPAFSDLHPQLQQLHEHGGALNGEIQIDYGTGIAGWMGRSIAKKLGLPPRSGPCGFAVDISHTADALLWRRTFAGQDS